MAGIDSVRTMRAEVISLDDDLIIDLPTPALNPSKVEVGISEEDDGMLISLPQKPASPDLKLPCVVLSGKFYEHELEYLHNVKPEEPVPLYVTIEGQTKQIGNCSLDIKTIIIYRRLGYKTTLMSPTGSAIDLDSVENEKLFNFVKL